MADQRFQQNLISSELSLDQEWLQESQKNFRYGIFKFALPIAFIFSIYDYAFLNEQFSNMLWCRLLMVPILFIGAYYINLSTTKKSFIINYLVTLAAFSIVQTALIYITKEPTQLYFLGLLTIAIGVFSFVTLPTKHFIFANLIIFLPYFMISLFTGFAFAYPMHFTAYLMNSIATIIIFDYFRRNTVATKIQEFNLRKSLNELLIIRDNSVNELAQSLSKAVEMENIRAAEYKNKEQYYKFARQITHDLRSPLTALYAIAKNIKGIDEETADLLSNCTKRISDIADSLSTQFQAKTISESQFSAAELSAAIHFLVKEKSTKFNLLNKHITINFTDLNPINIKICMNREQLVSIISNVIDNSIDALIDQGKIEILFSLNRENQLVIQVEDNGKGIPDNILYNLGTYGFSYDKPNGTGIALATGIKLLRYYGGDLKIESKLNSFTRVKIFIPIIYS